MKLLSLLFLFIINAASAQPDFIFEDGFEAAIIPVVLNDTGITWAGEYPSGNNVECISTTISSPQDCMTGRDALQNDPNDGHAGFSFTKLDENGAPLIDQTVDYDTTQWACVLDNVTGLVWEVKTTTVDIHNKDYTYQWGGLTAIGIDHLGREGIYYDSWNTLVIGSNDETLCGFNNWRVPTIDELSGILNQGTFNPAIDLNYFPNTNSIRYWSSSPYADFSGSSWAAYFSFGNVSFGNRIDNYHVRLVNSPVQ